MIVSASVIINADVNKVWETFTDLTCWKSWNTVITDVSDETPNALAEGGQFNFCIRPFTVPFRLEAKVEEVVRARKIVWSARKFGVFARHEFLFEDLADGTRVTSIETFAGFRLALACFRLGKNRLGSLTSQMLDELKKVSENSTRSR